jgi:HK97 family phage prohead protease
MKNTFYFSLDIVKSGTNKDNKFFIEGYAATKDLDRQGDIIVLDALEHAAAGLLEFGNTVFFNHDYNRCVGRLDEVKVDDVGLWVKIYISQWEEELRKKIEEGIIGKFSIGGRVMEGERVQPTEAQRRFNLKTRPTEAVKVISRMELFEVSVVGLPANAHAEFAHKSLCKALEDMSHNEDLFNIKDAGQIPDNTTTGTPLPKPIAKNAEETIMEDVKTEEVTPVIDTPATKDDVIKEAVVEATKELETIVAQEVKKEEPVAAPEATPEVVKETAPEVVKAEEVKVEEIKKEEQAVAEPAAPVVITEQHQSESVLTIDPANATMKQESVSADVVVTETPEKKITETSVVHAVRTYTEEEVNAIKALYEKQLEEKEVLIKTLSAKVDEKIEKADPTPAPEAEPVTKDLQAEPAKEEVEVTTKSTPLAPDVKAPLVVEEKKPFDVEKGFLNMIKGKRK